MSGFDYEIADALLYPEHQDRVLARTTLRYAVQRAIFCPYCGKILDIRDAVLLDGSDHGGKMHILHAAEYDRVIEAEGNLAALEEKFGHKIDVLDGRELFS